MINKQENLYQKKYEGKNLPLGPLTDCSPKGFRKIQENLERAVKVQKEVHESNKEYFTPNFSKKLEESSRKLTNEIKKYTQSYMGEKMKFGGLN